MEQIRKSIIQRLSDVIKERDGALKHIETLTAEQATLQEMLKLSGASRAGFQDTEAPTPKVVATTRTPKRMTPKTYTSKKLSWNKTPTTPLMRDIHRVILPLLKRRGYMEGREAAKILNRDKSNAAHIAHRIGEFYGINVCKVWDRHGINKVLMVHMTSHEDIITALSENRKRLATTGTVRTFPTQTGKKASGIWDKFHNLFGYKRDIMEPVLEKLISKKRLGPRMVGELFHEDEWAKLSTAIFTTQKDWMEALGVGGAILVEGNETTPILQYRVRG